MSDSDATGTTKKALAAKNDDSARIAAGRGPAYASIPLREAVRRITQIKDANAARTALSPETIYRIWEFKGASGASRPILASVGYYGLLEPMGRGDDRRLKLSELALRIVFDKLPNSPERRSALQEAALKPSIHARLMGEYGLPLPADVIIERYLVRDRHFNESSAMTVLKVYKDTLEYAGFGDDGSSDAEEYEDLSEPPMLPELPTSRAPARVGDFVQWTSAGVDQFKEPRRVIAISEDQNWLWVDGSKTGIRVSEVEIITSSDSLNIPPPSPLPNRSAAEALSEINQSNENDWKILHDGDRIRLSASVDLKGLKKLVKLLDGYKAILAAGEGDDDENE